jgi:hypothetical protein
VRKLLWLAATVLLVAGCTASGHEAPAALPDPRPLSGVLYVPPANAALLHDAEEAAVRDCMQERGFEYHVIPVRDPWRLVEDNPYGLLQPDRAVDDGYGITVQRLGPSTRDPNDKVLRRLSDAQRQRWQEALVGRKDGHRKLVRPDGVAISYDPGACVESGFRSLYGKPWTERFRALEGVGNQVVTATLHSAGYRAAERKWAACMAEEGHSYRTPGEPRTEIQERVAKTPADSESLREAGRAELALARADLACQQQARLHQAAAAGQRQAEKPIRADWEAEIAAHRQARNQALERARSGAADGTTLRAPR